MKKSTEFGIAGASLLTAGFGLMISLVASMLNDTGGLGLVLIYTTAGAAFVSIGVFWLWKAQGFYVAERKREALPASRP